MFSLKNIYTVNNKQKNPHLCIREHVSEVSIKAIRNTVCSLYSKRNAERIETDGPTSPQWDLLLAGPRNLSEKRSSDRDAGSDS